MKKSIMILSLATLTVANGFGQVSRSNGLPVNANPVTQPGSISQFEVSGRLITHNAFSGLGAIPLTQQTGNFGTAARWNSMGALNAGSQILNGFRTQTNGRGLTSGYSVVGITVGNPTIQWIGNAGVGVTPGTLDFKYANSPGSPGFPQPDVTMFRMSPQGISFLPFSHATQGALIGQLEQGSLGDFGLNSIWSATGVVNTPSFLTYGTRHQLNGQTFNSGLIFNNTTKLTDAIIDYGASNNLGASINSFKFRTFSNPTDLNSNRNIWQSRPDFGNIMLGRTDIYNVNTKPFYFSLFDGKSAQAGFVAQTFIDRAGIYATSAGFDEFGNPLNNYAAICGDVSLASKNGFSHIGILGISDDDVNTGGNKWAGYFVGSAVITGTLINPSDRKFKTDIKDEQNILERIMLLKPKNYLFDTKTHKNMAFSSKLQHGLISQDVEEVFPELVQNVNGPSTSENPKENGKSMQYKALNYSGLIPILLKGIQEQQSQIEELKTQLKSAGTNKTFVLNDKINLPTEIENKAFTLSQNTPNPFSERTTISYTIPSTVKKATLAVFDMTGKMLLQYNLAQGKNQLLIDGNTLPAGMYLYSLLADGQEVLSKRMVLTK